MMATASQDVVEETTSQQPAQASGAPELPGRNRRLLVLLPLAAFLGLAALFFVRLGAGDSSRIPSALIGHEAPATDLPPVAGLERNGAPIPGIATADFKDAVTVLNVWASWCVPVSR